MLKLELQMVQKAIFKGHFLSNCKGMGLYICWIGTYMNRREGGLFWGASSSPLLKWLMQIDVPKIKLQWGIIEFLIDAFVHDAIANN